MYNQEQPAYAPLNFYTPGASLAATINLDEVSLDLDYSILPIALTSSS
jgi:hypothetical protein